MNEVINNIFTRRSIRTYEERQINDEDLNLILEAAKYAPSAKNEQPWLFTVVQNENFLNELNDVIKEALDSPEFKATNYYGEDFKVPENYNFCYKAPTLIIVSAARDYRNKIADGSVALENIFLAAHSLGLGSCWINQPGLLGDYEVVRKVLTKLQIPEDFTVCGCSALGYAIRTSHPKPRKKDNVIYIK